MPKTVYTSIYKVAECEHCRKLERLNIAVRKWFIVNNSHAYCTETCFLLEKDNVETK